MKHTRILILLLTLIYTSLHAHAQLYIIIPGTWGAESEWALPGGDFYETLHAALPNDAALITFSWSGKNKHASRIIAAQNLAQLIHSYPPETEITIIAHSHGGNVGILASQMLQPDQRITCFYSLGTPVDQEEYSPALHAIDNFYHLFSFSDFVQPVGGLYERVFDTAMHITNIAVTINGVEPNHTQLHAACIAQWLPDLHYYLSLHEVQVTLHVPFIMVDFTMHSIPEYCISGYADAMLAQDAQLIRKYTAAFVRKRKKFAMIEE